MNNSYGVLRPNPENKFKYPDGPVVKGLYRTLIEDLGYGKVSDAPEITIKSVELYLHVLGLRKAKPNDLRRWKALNVIDDKEEFLDDSCEIHVNEECELSDEEYNRLIMNITLHSLAWGGFVVFDPDDHTVLATGKRIEEGIE